MKTGYRYDAKTCFKCGQLVRYNWYIRHRPAGACPASSHRAA